jgi:hypothetical protein
MKQKVLTIAACAAAAVGTFQPQREATAQVSSYAVVKVTSLADSGAGTLRECINRTGPRMCVFEVGGRIKLASNLTVSNPDIIVAGQTAPSPGITVTHAGIQVRAPRVRLEHLTVRVGDDTSGPSPDSRDGLSVQNSSSGGVLLKNLSVSWAIDENFSAYTAMTMENCIIAEALHDSLHSKGPHSMGALVGETARNVVFKNNLFASNNDRNIRWKYDTQGAMINNVIYGWGGTSSWNTTNLSDVENTGKSTLIDIIGNHYIPGPQGLQTAYAVYSQATSGNTKVYLSDNIVPRLTNLASQYISSSRLFNGTTAMPSAQTYEYVLANAGSRPWERSADDRRIIDGVRARTLRIRDAVGTWPTFTSTQRSLSVPTSVAAGEVDSFLSSYTQGGTVATPTATPTPTRTATPTPTPSPTQTQMPTATATPLPPIAGQKVYDVIKVTNLNDSGVGSLRECVAQPNPRVCVFETSGRIKLASDIVVDKPDLIIVGQTAPSPGILITNGGFTVLSNNVRIEHLAIRSGDESSGTAPKYRRSISIRGTGASNVRLSNLSMSWGVDSNVLLNGSVKDVTIKDSIIAEALYRSIHPEGARGNGVLVGEKARNVIFHGNLLAANYDRNIRWKYNTRGEMINNLIFGWGGTTSWNTTNISDVEKRDIGIYLDVIGNVYVTGSEGLSSAYAVYSQRTPAGTRLFLSNNIVPRLTNVASQFRSATRLLAGPEPIPASDTAAAVYEYAGSRPWDRNADDVRIIAGVKARTLKIRNRVGTWPTYAANQRSVELPGQLNEEQLDAVVAQYQAE